MNALRKALLSLLAFAVVAAVATIAFRLSLSSGTLASLLGRVGIGDGKVQEVATEESLEIPRRQQEAANPSSIPAANLPGDTVSVADNAKNIDKPEAARRSDVLAASLAPRIKVVGPRPEPGASLFCSFEGSAFPRNAEFEISWYREGETPGAESELAQQPDGSYIPLSGDASSYIFCKVSSETEAGSAVEAASEIVLIMQDPGQGS